MPVSCRECAPLAEGLGFEVPRTHLHPLLSATTEVALPRDHDQRREEVEFAGRADQCLVRQYFQRFLAIIYRHQ